MIWELLRISPAILAEVDIDSLGKSVFSCSPANDTVQGVVKSPKALLTAGYITYDLKGIYDTWQRHVYWGFYTSIS